MSHDLFLSFATEHRELVDRFRATPGDRLSLVAFGDRTVPGGHRWKTHAESLIRSSRATLCLIGRATRQSEPVNWEIRKSVELGKRVVAACLEPTELFPDALVEAGVSPLPLDVDAIAVELGTGTQR